MLTQTTLQVQFMPQEYVQGQLKNRYGDAFIRGNNGTRNWYQQLLFTGQISTGHEPCFVTCSPVHQHNKAMSSSSKMIQFVAQVLRGSWQPVIWLRTTA